MNFKESAFSSSSSFDDLAKLDTKDAENIDDNIIQTRNETINNLQTQLNEMMEKLKEMDNITTENQKLRQEKFEMESKYNSLDDRFQICLKINENIKKDLQKLTKEKEDFEMRMKQLEITKINLDQKANQEKRELEEELEKARSNSNEIYKKQIAQLNDSIIKLRNDSDFKVLVFNYYMINEFQFRITDQRNNCVIYKIVIPPSIKYISDDSFDQHISLNKF